MLIWVAVGSTVLALAALIFAALIVPAQKREIKQLEDALKAKREYVSELQDALARERKQSSEFSAYLNEVMIIDICKVSNLRDSLDNEKETGYSRYL